MSSLDSFLPYVRPWAPGVSNPAAFRHIRLAVQEFCERTRLWKYEDSFDVTADDCIGGIFTPNGSMLHDVETVLFNGQELLPIANVDLDRVSPGWREGDASTGLPKFYTQIEQNTLKIVPPMDGTVYLSLRLKPTQDTTDIPDFIASEYAEVIGWGALARLLTIPGQSFSNPEMSTFYAAKFTEKIDRLSTKGTTGQMNAKKRTRARFF